MTTTATTDPTAVTARRDERADAEPVDDEALIEDDEVLVEEVSIDGMCGVY